MASNLTTAVNNIGNATTGTLEVSTRVIDQSVKLVGTAVNQGSAVATAALEGVGAVATSAVTNTTEVATASLTAAKDISKVGLNTTTVVVASAGEITNTAAKTTAGIANVTLGTVGEVAKDANKTVQLSSKLATGLTNNVLEGITNMNQILGGAGENQVISIRNSQESTKAVLTSGIGTTASTKKKLDVEFGKFVVNMKGSVKQLVKLQASSIESVRVFIVKFYCTGMFARMFRQCPPKPQTDAAKMDMTKYARQLQVVSGTLMSSFDKFALDAQAKIKLIPITDTQVILTSYKAIFDDYCSKVAAAMESYTATTNAILEKHTILLKKITDDQVTGGRRKSSRRRNRRRSTLRAS